MKKGQDVYRVLNETYEYAFSAVPDSKRKSTSQLFLILIGFASSTSGVAVGAEIGRHMSLFWAVSACVAGNLLLFFVALFWGFLGYKTGYSSVFLVKNVLGNCVGYLFSLFIILSTIIWVGMNGEWLANIMIAIFPKWPIPVALTTLLLIALGTLLALRGWKGLELCARLFVPMIAFLAVYTMVRIGVTKGGFHDFLHYQPAASIAFSAAVTIVMGNFATSACTMPNLCRFAKSGRAVLHCIAAYTLTLTFNNVSGILIIQAMGANNLSYGVYLLGMVVSNFIWMLLCVYTTQNVNMYTGSLAIQGLVRGTGMGGNISHQSAVLFMGALSAIVGVVGITRYLSVVTSALVLLLMPLTGILLAELRLRETMGPTKTSVSMLAWAFGVLVGGVVWLLTGSTEGMLLILSSGLFYAWLRRRAWKREEQSE